ncbi:MAG: hypothetical protein V3U03_11570 [Myxococcota bacterium]
MVGGRSLAYAIAGISAVVIPRLLGAEGYGRYAAVMAVLAILQTASTAGLPMVEIRYLAPAWQLGNRSAALALGSTIWTTRLLLSALGAAAAVAWLGFSPALGLGLGVCLLIGLLCLVRCAQEATRSLFIPTGHVGKAVALELLRAALTLPVVVFSFQALGLTGVFAALPVMHGLLLALALGALVSVVPIRPALFRWPSLRPHLAYAGFAFVGTLAAAVQTQFAVYAVAAWVATREAGFLGLTVQVYALSQGLFLAARRGLMPILAELEELGQTERLRQWGGTMMRYAAAASCVGVVGWALLGRSAIELLLTDAFAPVYPCVALILVAVMFYCAGASCNGLLYLRGLAGSASANNVIYAVATALGLLRVVAGDGVDVAFRVSGVYAGASALFFACAYASLGVRGRIWLPAGHSLLLMAPAVLAWPAALWQAELGARAAAAAAFAASYGFAAVGLRLLPADELRDVLRALRGGASDDGGEPF